MGLQRGAAVATHKRAKYDAYIMHRMCFFLFGLSAASKPFVLYIYVHVMSMWILLEGVSSHLWRITWPLLHGVHRWPDVMILAITPDTPA